MAGSVSMADLPVLCRGGRLFARPEGGGIARVYPFERPAGQKQVHIISSYIP
jgi:hypothetical protein